MGGELVVALERAFAEAAAHDGILVGGGVEIGVQREAGAVAGHGLEGDDADETWRRVVAENLIGGGGVAVDDAFGRGDFDEDAVGGEIAAVGRAHHVVPAAAFAEIELDDRVGEAFRAPPAAQVIGVGEHLPDELARRIELALDLEAAIVRDEGEFGEHLSGLHEFGEDVVHDGEAVDDPLFHAGGDHAVAVLDSVEV